MSVAPALATAEAALLDERRPLTRAEVGAVAALDLDQLPDLVALAHRVRLAYCGDAVELESLINAKSGACPEDCAFCSQSARFESEVDVYPFLDLDEVLGAARATREAGATQFCIVVAVRGPEERLLTKVIDAVHAVHDETGLEVACSLGLLKPEQATRLAEAGVRRYNHNLETCREVFPTICTTHTYDDRVTTARLAIDSGMELCSGGILGMGETLDQRIDFAFELAALDPCEVPINLLDPRPGTPLEDQTTLSPREALQAIALFRLVLPSTWIRLAGGRERVLGELQALGLLAGANALIVGNYLTTTGRSADEDLALLDALGMPVADGPGEGRFIVDGTGGHAMPARPSTTGSGTTGSGTTGSGPTTIPVTSRSPA
ncbi:MAG: biotin synthase BioB [Acidimicrobiia bacterium]